MTSEHYQQPVRIRQSVLNELARHQVSRYTVRELYFQWALDLYKKGFIGERFIGTVFVYYEEPNRIYDPSSVLYPPNGAGW